MSSRMCWFGGGILAVFALMGIVLSFFLPFLVDQRNIGTGNVAPLAPPRVNYGSVGDFTLTERSGRGVRAADLAGKVWIADFVFTRCPGPCPAMSGKMAVLQKDLAGVADLRFVSVSVDPENDSPEALKAYADRFGADPERWLFLTGPAEAVRNLVMKGFKLALAADGTGPAGVTHSTRFVLVDRKGVIRGYFDSDDPTALARLKREAGELAREP